MTLYRPEDEKQVADVVAAAGAARQTLEIVAGGTKRAFGRPVTADHVLDVSQLAAIVNYEPAELILTAQPGVKLAALKAALQARGQMLAFAPPYFSALLGGVGEVTLGGVLSCNLSGSRRVRAGAARDYLLGFSAVNGRGEIFKAGGKVVKNVTGFDMSKLLVGAFGTLSVLTEVTLKVMPRPETETTILLAGLTAAEAVKAMAAALNTPHEISCAAHLPAPAARKTAVGAAVSVTALRLEGPAPSVAFRAGEIEQLFGKGARLDGAESGAFWAQVGEAQPLLPSGERLVWRLCPPPSLAAAVVEAIEKKLASAEVFYDWGGGLVWVSLDPAEAGPDAGAGILRGAMQPGGGHATLIGAPQEVRARVSVFEPQPPALAALSARVKNGFDPLGLFNPGRMSEGL